MDSTLWRRITNIAAQKPHKGIYKIRGTCQEKMARSSKTKVKRAVISRTGISREEAEYTVDSGASMQITSRNDCVVEEHDTIRTSKESGTIISAWCVCVCMVARFFGTESFALRASSCWLPCWLANVGSPSQLRTQTNETPPHL